MRPSKTTRSRTFSHREIFNNITEKNVKSALDSLVYCSQSPKRSPLEKLILVDQALANEGFPPRLTNRSIGLADVLTSRITTELIRHRVLLSLPSMLLERSLQHIYELIKQDAKTGNHDLVGWSWLYHRYVRVEIDIDPDVFSNLSCIDVRTLNRYQIHAIRRLTNILILEEVKVRR